MADDAVESPHSSGTDEKMAVAAFEHRLRELTPRIYATPALVAINIVVFVVMIASGVSAMSPGVPELLDWGANYGPWTTDGQWWRLLTCTFVHAGILHIAFNMFVLADVGRRVERLVGSAGFLAMYLVSGLLGSVASIAVNPTVTSVGASGAVFGVLGCLLGFLVLQRGSISPEALKPMGRDAAAFVLYNVVFGLGHEGIDMAAHMGGLAAGFVCGLVLALPLDETAKPRRRSRALATLALGGAALAVGAALLPASPTDFQGEVRRFSKVENSVVTSINDVMERAQKGELTDPEAVEILQRDVLAPWRGALERWRAMDLDGLSDQEREAHASLLHYATLRAEAFQLLIEGVEEQDEAKIEAANKKAAEAAALVEKAK